ncbi:MAG: hypothetical protein ACE5FT_05570 [Candidatus Nanoarchaeia archaeon]
MVEVEEFKSVIYNMIAHRGINVTVNPITRTYSNITGDEHLTSGAGVSHKVLIANKMWRTTLDKEGRFVDADAFIITNGSVTFDKLDWITYGGSMFEVRMTDVRRYKGSGLFSFATLYAKT